MTLSSITADVHELQARCLLCPMPSETAAASAHLLNVGINTNISQCALPRCTNMIFQRPSTMARFLAASVHWCSVSGVNARAPSSGIIPKRPAIPDFLFDQHLTG